MSHLQHQSSLTRHGVLPANAGCAALGMSMGIVGAAVGSIGGPVGAIAGGGMAANTAMKMCNAETGPWPASHAPMMTPLQRGGVVPTGVGCAAMGQAGQIAGTALCAPVPIPFASTVCGAVGKIGSQAACNHLTK